MYKLQSKYKLDELSRKYDDRVSPARYAGNDEDFDRIFISKRNGNRFSLVFKAKSIRDPFTTVFHGAFCEDDNGNGCIKGYFSKSVFDYIVIALFFAFIMVIRSEIQSRGAPLSVVNTLLIIYFVLAVFLLYTFKSTKERYFNLLSDATGIPFTLRKSKDEQL